MSQPTGPELRAARLTAGLTVAAVADALHVSHARVRGLETQKGLRPDTAQRYVRALHEAWSTRERLAMAEVLAAPTTSNSRELVRELVTS